MNDNDQQEERNAMWRNVVSGKALDVEPRRKQVKIGCLSIIFLLLFIAVVVWFSLQ